MERSPRVGGARSHTEWCGPSAVGTGSRSGSARRATPRARAPTRRRVRARCSRLASSRSARSRVAASGAPPGESPTRGLEALAAAVNTGGLPHQGTGAACGRRPWRPDARGAPSRGATAPQPSSSPRRRRHQAIAARSTPTRREHRRPGRPPPGGRTRCSPASEFDASRFAPCAPGAGDLADRVQPRQASYARGCRSRRRPSSSARPASRARVRAPSRSRAHGRPRRSSGSAAPGMPPPRAVASSSTGSPPCAAISTAMPRATTSRGASSASGCTSSMKRSPAALRSTAPSPRTASDTRNEPRDRERRRVELVELEVGEVRARTPGRRDAVAGRHRGVGGVRVELPCSAAGEHDGVGLDGRRSSRRLEHPRRPRPRRRRRPGRSGTRARRRASAETRTARTRARSISAPVASPPACSTRALRMRGLEPAGQVAARAVEGHPERDQVADALRPLGAQHLDGLALVRARRRPAACRPRAPRHCRRRNIAAAMPPCA